MKFSDNSRIELYRLIIRPFGEDNFRVARWGGRSKVLTRQFGLEAIQLMQQGQTVGETRVALARRHGVDAARVNLTPLLEALEKAGFMKEIDGQPAGDGRRPSFLDSLWLFWRYYAHPWIRKLADDFLPIALARRLGFWTHAIDLRREMAPALAHAARNMAAIWSRMQPAEVRELVAGFYREWIWNVVDVHTFETRRPAVIDRWISNHTSIQGLEHLEEARRNLSGVILCVFHFSSTRLIPMLLMQRGYCVTAIGPSNMGWGTDKTQAVLERFRTELPTYGQLRLFTDFRLQNLHNLVDALQAGEIACCMADVIPGAPGAEHAPAPEIMNHFRYAAQDFPRASAPVDFLGQRLEMTAWVGWLAAVSGATVLPTFMLRDAKHNLQLRIGPPLGILPLQQAAAAAPKLRDAVNAALYRRLEEYVGQYPSQWFAWHNLHHVGLGSAAKRPQSVPARRKAVKISS